MPTTNQNSDIYGLTINTNELRPRYKLNDYLTVARNSPCHEGEDVIIKLKNRPLTVKTLLAHDANRIVVGDVNTSKDQESYSSSDYEYIHPITGICNPRLAATRAVSS